MIGIYKITCIKDGKVYIGQSICVNKRITNHKSALRRNKHSNQLLQNAWNKYGEENFTFSIEKECLEEELDKIENEIIKNYGWPNNKLVFNLEDGGNKNKHLSQDTKNKIRLKHLGTHVTEETKNKISKTTKGKKLSEETKQKISKARIGRHPTLETLKKMSIVASGKNNGHYGIPRTEEEKQKIREHNPNIKIVQQFTKEGELVAEHLGTYMASKKANTTQSHIIQVCNNTRKTAGGYVWKYKKDTQ